MSTQKMRVGATAGSRVRRQSVMERRRVDKKVRHEENERGLGQLRGLKGKDAELDPAMRIVRAIQKKNCHQQEQVTPRVAKTSAWRFSLR